jgi:tyrosine-protein kinase Etk/Wzc
LKRFAIVAFIGIIAGMIPILLWSVRLYQDIKKFDNLISQFQVLKGTEITFEQFPEAYTLALRSSGYAQNIKNDIYSFLLQKREETAYSINAANPDCTLVDEPASSIKPVTPKKPVLALIAGMLPLVLGFLVITIKEQLNRKILYRSDIEKLTSFPVIGELIYDKEQKNVFNPAKERSFIIEQFRQIRTALKYQGTPPGNYKRILVTSSVKGEGKSFISSNLAYSLAKSGKKVALLELDL